MDNEIAAIHETSKMTSQSEKSKSTGLGARLRKTRESMHLTQKEAAARLYLNPKIVEIIENEAFFDGPPMTFMRGYLRSYARLLNFPESDVKAAIDELELTTSPTTPTAPTLQTSPIYRGDRYIRWITYLIVLTLISLVVIWWTSHSKYVIADVPGSNQAPAAANAPDVTTSETPKAASMEGTVVNTTTLTTPTPATPEPAKTEPTTPALQTAPSTSITQAPINVEPAAATTPPAAVTPPQPMGGATLPTTETINTPVPTAGAPPAQDLIVPPAEPSIDANNATAMPDMNNHSTHPMLENATSKEKPVTKHKRKHRRHSYHPIENMDIPEPE